MMTPSIGGSAGGQREFTQGTTRALAAWHVCYERHGLFQQTVVFSEGAYAPPLLLDAHLAPLATSATVTDAPLQFLTSLPLIGFFILISRRWIEAGTTEPSPE